MLTAKATLHNCTTTDPREIGSTLKNRSKQEDTPGTKLSLFPRYTTSIISIRPILKEICFRIELNMINIRWEDCYKQENSTKTNGIEYATDHRFEYDFSVNRAKQ